MRCSVCKGPRRRRDEVAAVLSVLDLDLHRGADQGQHYPGHGKHQRHGDDRFHRAVPPARLGRIFRRRVLRVVDHQIGPGQELGVPPVLGRVFGLDASADDRSVVLSHPLWQSQFGGDAAVLGRAINLNGATYVVIGVMPVVSASSESVVLMVTAMSMFPIAMCNSGRG